MDWDSVEDQLTHFQGLSGLHPLTLDTLYGSVFAMRWRVEPGMDISFAQAMAESGQEVVAYSLQRIRALREAPDFTFTPRQPIRCGMGLGTFGWKYDHGIIHEAVECGVSLIDTAEGYGYGRVETALGEALKECGQVEVTTKVRRDHMSPLALGNAVKRSVEKLGLVPHMQLHYPSQKYPDAVKRLVSCRKAGLIKSIGLGNCSVDQIEAAQRFLSDFSGDVIRSVQVRFNLLDQRVKGALLPYCQARGILVLAYSPLGQRLKDLIRPALLKVAKAHDCSPARVALAWILEHRGVMPIPRANSLAHLHDNLAAVQLRLTTEDILALAKEYPDELL